MAYSRDSRVANINQFGFFPLVVTAKKVLSQHFVRVSLAGPALHHAVDEISDGTGDVLDGYIKLMLAPASSETGIIDLTLDEQWRHRYMSASPEERGWIRTYTVRDSRLVPAASVPEVGAEFVPCEAADLSVLDRELPAGLVPEIDIDFVLHADAEGKMGPGSAWARDIEVGERTAILAPMRGNLLWASWNPGAASRLVLLADETAVPAVLSAARSLRSEVQADILLEVPGPADVWDWEAMALGEDYALTHPGVRFHWLPRGQDGASEVRGEELYCALRKVLNLALPEQLPATDRVEAEELVWGLADQDQELYIFIAGESSIIKTMRRICVNDAGIDKKQISFMGYWKQGRAEN